MALSSCSGVDIRFRKAFEAYTVGSKALSTQPFLRNLLRMLISPHRVVCCR